MKAACQVPFLVVNHLPVLLKHRLCGAVIAGAAPGADEPIADLYNEGGKGQNE